LDRYYATPVCSPTRAGLLTGRSYLRTGLYNTRFGGDTLGKQERTLPESLREAGYRTGLFGKWHLGKYPGYQPHQRGFDEFMGHYHGHIERYQFPDQLHHNGKRVEARGYVTDLFTDAAIDFIEHSQTSKRQPFFCALMYNAPHSPFLLDTSHLDQESGDQLISKYVERGLPLREARIYGMIERVDQNLGRLLEKLSELKIREETIVVFTSDNGGVSKFYSGGMRGRKASVYEGGVRAPCFVTWPGIIPPDVKLQSMTTHLDWFPTLCELAGVNATIDRPIDGVSMVELLKSGRDRPIRRFVYHTWDRYTPNPFRRWAIRDRRWKLLCQLPQGADPNEASVKKHWRLFDMSVDASESINLAKKHPEVTARLRTEFLRWFGDVTAGQDYRPIRIPVGSRSAHSTELSPSWATLLGAKTRYVFDGYDWDTIEGWREESDGCQWRLEVLRDGDYELLLRYGCNPSAAGSTIRLSLISTDGLSEPVPSIHRVRATATANQFETFSVGKVSLERGNWLLRLDIPKTVEKEVCKLNRVQIEDFGTPE
ncbi:MAG: sulfatase-like hydrolase/transferase, partial [Planctomycetota bacterium]